MNRRVAFESIAGAALGWGALPPAAAQSATATGVPAGQQRENQLDAKLKEHPSVFDTGAKGDGVAMDGAAIQDALNAFGTVWVPPGTYQIDVPLTVPSYCVLAFSSKAIFCPAHDRMTVFQTGEVSYASRILAPRVHARGKQGITAFDMQGFRHRAEIQHADIEGCARGILLRELCWDTLLYMPWIRQTRRPIIISNGSNAVDVIHPGLDDFDVGIQIEAGSRYPTTSTRIWGGYVQNGRCGIFDDRAIGTVVDGTYFEGLREADIVLSRAIRSNLARTQHYGETGRVAIQTIGADGTTIFDPVMSSGARTIGLYDFDAASRNITRFESGTETSLNQPLGNAGASGRLVREEGGGFVPVIGVPDGQLVLYTKQEGRWRKSSGQSTVALALRWSKAPAGTNLVVSGVPAPARPPAGALLLPTAALVENNGNVVSAYARLDGEGNLHVFTIENGRERPVAIGAQGALSVSVTSLV